MRIRTRSAAVAATHPAAALASGAPADSAADCANSRRRRFLFTLGVSGAGVAVSAAASVSAVSAVTEATAESAVAPDGYRETQHVRDYYRTAKI